MIKGTFKFGGQLMEVIVRGNELMFNDVQTNTITTIEGLKFSKQGVIKEFPDLKDNENWRQEAIRRLKEHINLIKTEKERLFYVQKELNRFGYNPLFYQIAGHRPKKFT